MDETKGFSINEHDNALNESERRFTKEGYAAGNDGEVNNKVVQQPEEKGAPSPQEEEAVIKKKYGGILPKKPPLISKDHERAFFDSADWALGKQGAPLGQKPKGPIEALRPKLQPTPHQPLPARRPAYASPEGEDEELG